MISARIGFYILFLIFDGQEATAFAYFNFLEDTLSEVLPVQDTAHLSQLLWILIREL